MPIDPVTLTAGVAAATTGFNIWSTGNQNRKNRAFSEEQRQKQYQSTLDFWRLNNQYNHPSAQMARLREAGLNPHLVYGNGTVANSSSAPQAPQQSRWQGEAPQANPQNQIGMLDTYQNIQVKQAQVDNMREQNTLLKQEQELKRIGILQGLLNYDIQDSTKRAVIEKVIMDLDKTRSEIIGIDTRVEKDKASISNDRMRVWNDIARTETTVLDSAMKRKLMEAGIQETQVDTQGKEIINKINAIKFQLWEDGINPNDPTYLRVLVSAIQKMLGQPITSPLKSGK